MATYLISDATIVWPIPHENCFRAKRARLQVTRSDGALSMPIWGIIMAFDDAAAASYFWIIFRTQGTSPVTSR